MTLARLAPLFGAAGLVLAGCGGGKASPAASGPALVLDILGPPDGSGAQLGLHYSNQAQLKVRYHTDDAAAKPIAGAVVHYSIFKDPAGSTLASDHGVTDADGVATVTLTAGQAEASFVVAATATNAPEADFDINVSKLDFVELDVHLAWAGTAADTTLRAQLFNDMTCAALAPTSTTAPTPLRSLVQVGSNAATLKFMNLLSESYAVVGRAEQKLSGQLAGYACVDIGAGLVPPGTTSTLPLQLAPVLAAPAGSYTLTSLVTPAAARTAAVLAPWQPLGCAAGPAQLLLDAIEIASPALVASLEAHRTAAGADGCRPATSALDSALQTLLVTPSATVKDPPALHLGDIYADLQSIVGTATLTSTLTVTAAGADSFSAEHTLVSLALAVDASSQLYDLVRQGEPIIDVPDIVVGYDGTTLMLGEHGFTLDWPALWLEGLNDLSLAVRVPGLTAPVLPALANATVAAAMRNGKSDCAAVSDLVCSIVGGPCDVSSACTSAKAAIGAAWAAPLQPESGIDLSLSGSATVVAGSDLAVAALGGGLWSSPQLAKGTFTGKRD